MNEVNTFDYDQPTDDYFSEEHTSTPTDIEPLQDDFGESESDNVNTTEYIGEEEPYEVGDSIYEEDNCGYIEERHEECDSVANNDRVESKKDISFNGRYECTCGCTHFVDIGGNECKCGHSWWKHKFWEN